MTRQRAAVLGVGQTHHRSRRTDVSIAGLCREAVDRALGDAGLSLADIDAVVAGKAPDLFEGVMMPELYLADALGAVGHRRRAGGRRGRSRRRRAARSVHPSGTPAAGRTGPG